VSRSGDTLADGLGHLILPVYSNHVASGQGGYLVRRRVSYGPDPNIAHLLPQEVPERHAGDLGVGVWLFRLRVPDGLEKVLQSAGHDVGLIGEPGGARRSLLRLQQPFNGFE
jgi:hypothetical protein